MRSKERAGPLMVDEVRADTRKVGAAVNTEPPQLRGGADAGPRVDLGYLSDERDYGLLADGVRGCWELARDYIDRAVDSAYNPVGTVRMGAPGDPWAVVNQRCAVYRAENLHVVDASIMPSMVCANTHLTVVMIAERAAALLRES